MKIKWNQDAFHKVRTMPAVAAEVQSIGDRIADACGDGYVSEPAYATRTRARSVVITTTVAAQRDNAINNTMLHNIEAGRTS